MIDRILTNREKTVFWTLLGCLVISVGFYMYLINTTVKNVVTAQNLEGEISKLNLVISSKEFQYIKNRNAVTLSLAHSMGFRDVTPKTYINDKSIKGVSFLPN